MIPWRVSVCVLSPIQSLMALTLSRAAARRLLPRLTPSSMASSASSSSPSGRLLLPDAVSRLDSLAPPALAESWDNVGLLLQPSAPKAVSKVMLTNDLTDPVLKEAVGLGVDLLVSYHPPVFKALKRVTQANWKVTHLATYVLYFHARLFCRSAL